jgi:uncharacterized protein Yka (UPF0111/DUF47 family)
MWLDRAVKWLLPREEHFFDLLEKGADCAADAGLLLLQCCQERTPARREAVVQKVRDAEHASDRVIYEVYEALNKTFVTPLERSDIYNLATDVENVVDRITSTASMTVVHAMEDLPHGSVEIAEHIRRCTDEIRGGVRQLRSLKQLDAIRTHCNNIHKMEHDGDQVFRQQIGEMFKTERDAIRLLKHKEFLEGLEYTLDVCDDVANALETVVIKNA